MFCKIKPMPFCTLHYNFHDVEPTSIDDVCTLKNVVIANLTRIDLISWVALFYVVVAIVII
jgi:hypothetical protein